MEMMKLPQVELQTEHHHIDGVYVRVVHRPAGCLIVGKVHKKEHLYVVMTGSVRVTTDDGVKDVYAPCVIKSSPGTKRAVLALEDSSCMTIHRTDKEELEDIEEELIEPDNLALFDSWNKLKELPCHG
jgi:quercetin dioxygenase-like cupin family protein